MQEDLNQDIQDMQQRQANILNCYLSKLSTTVVSNTESLKKIKSNLNVMTQTISKLNTRLNMEKEIYSNQQKDINNCIIEIEMHVQNNKVIHYQFEENLDKAILHTEQVATKLFDACNKATSLKFQVPDSRIDNTNKTLHNHDEEIQKLMNKIFIYSQQKGHFTGTHSTVPNYNSTAELLPILKPTKH
eukprot:9575327-Ditylum_brightwellii.AAC.1